MNWRIRLPGALYRLARDKAGSDAALADLVTRYLDAWVSGTTAQALGGKARAESITPERRTEIARAGGLARQRKTIEADTELARLRQVLQQVQQMSDEDWQRLRTEGK